MTPTETTYTKMLAQLEDLSGIQWRGDTLGEKAINYYAFFFGSINENLREGIANIHVGFVCDFIANLPNFEGITYRGIRVDDLSVIYARYKPGNIITEKAFTSSSELKAVGEKFAGLVPDLSTLHDKRASVMFKIHSKTGKAISNYSGGYGRQKEVLFKPNSSFLVLDLSEHDDHIEIELEQI
ncbi:hypothetical protein H6G54_05210 [Anabaena cylindrica FACHB-243]|uniref:NAD(+)--protein-arginine ADP-ribosyltransferase n=1 Tax=Anabaena cylindrica (strain ATCC 27899 / PCC 7122) TaxID=272123 RepID=K9ZNL2_ANACC|nr:MULTISPECIES: ADP-ribosyltransferase domain-containing protein [Anabaena]AFZ60818.1 hypothetical protein Anacy_5506 [Anabaena cylindrica PCC 7122]MBD2417118.1 hypothetical protein [Anabaena cylindrica FACHB-243]MBY5280814.1 hypothetical protein [Anabaena sp. CCAP 1446/1C]MBY5307090.1 hypothetical protein [Anabaena sp. CCAP 1446/1C]MCM2406819.1 ADP-ribosyltransferase domain-containing protein [Anabaena sp. CCAP 1446/1C]